jgi:lipopolysaccharide transport system ATP-binding protein
MSSDIVIEAVNLSKCYQIYDNPQDRLKQFLIRERKKYYREFWALKNVSFQIKRGETVGIIGRNGSGKSTLLQLICGTLNPTEGHVSTTGRIAALLELGSGFNPEFNGRENVYLNAAVIGLSKSEIDEKFDAIAAFADIGEFIEQPIKSYSSGMLVRLAFAVGIVCNPRVMIVDEALAVGDMNFQAKCMTALKRLQQDGVTILFVSHDIGALRSLCTRGIYLDAGILKNIGDAGVISQHYEKDMRERLRDDLQSLKATDTIDNSTSCNSITQPLLPQIELAQRTEFEDRSAHFRYGDGGVRVIYADLLNNLFEPIRDVEFDQEVYVRLHIESSIQDEISCNYYVLDDKKNLIIGSGLQLAGNPLLRVNHGDQHIITFKTRMPLQEGLHSLQLQISKFKIDKVSTTFLDFIEDAIVFKMNRRSEERIWTKVHIPNKVEVIAF